MSTNRTLLHRRPRRPGHRQRGARAPRGRRVLADLKTGRRRRCCEAASCTTSHPTPAGGSGAVTLQVGPHPRKWSIRSDCRAPCHSAGRQSEPAMAPAVDGPETSSRAMTDEPEALGMLERTNWRRFARAQHVALADTARRHSCSPTLEPPGSLYETLQTVQARDISYAMFAQLPEGNPGPNRTLEELQRFGSTARKVPGGSSQPAARAPSRRLAGASPPPRCGSCYLRTSKNLREIGTATSRCSRPTPSYVRIYSPPRQGRPDAAGSSSFTSARAGAST